MRRGTLGVLMALPILVSPALAQVEEGLVSVSVGSGARALGMGGAFIAVADDATASSWNPAGLCVLEKAEASAVYQPYASYRTAYSALTTETRGPSAAQALRADAFDYEQRSSALDFASLTFPFRVGRVKLVPQFGYQRVVDLGLDGRYERRSSTTSAGSSTLTVERDGTDAKGGIDVLAAALGLSLTERLYLGASANFWRNGFEKTRTYRQEALTTDASGTIRSIHNREATFQDDYSGRNFTLGVLAKPTRWLRVGGVYKTAFTMDYEYRSHRSVVRGKDGTAPTTTEVDATKAGPIDWPRTLGAGFAIQPTDALTVSFDVTHSAWSKASIDQTGTQTQTNTEPRVPIVDHTWTTWPLSRNLAAPETAANPRQADGLQIRLGGEYVVLKPGLAGLTAVPVRLGVFRDRQISKNTPDLGGVYHLGLTTGVGLVWSRLSLDFAYVHTRGDSKCCGLQPLGGATPGQYEVVDASGNTVKQTVDENDSYRTHRLFVSSTIRF